MSLSFNFRFRCARPVQILGLLAPLAVACTAPPAPDDHGSARSALERGPEAMVHDEGWRVDQHIRLLGDVDNNGFDDLVGFFDDGVHVGFGYEQDGGGFTAPILGLADLGNTHGYSLANHVRTLADVDGDGHKDLVAFGNSSVFVALKDLDAPGWMPASAWLNDFAYNSTPGWRVNEHTRLLGDVNADGKDDLVGFNAWGTYVSLAEAGHFQAKKLWTKHFDASTGWDVAKHPRLLADVNDDGRADVVGFGNAGVSVALSRGTDFADSSLKSSSFGYSAGYRVGQHVRVLANVNGDRYPDIVGLGPTGTQVALGVSGGFGTMQQWSGEFGDATGWLASRHPRFVADVNGDSLDDVVGVKDDQIYVALSTGAGLQPMQPVSAEMTYDAGWRVEKHPRFVTDVDGDGLLDLIGFFDDAVYWERLAPPLESLPEAYDEPLCSAAGLSAPAGYCAGPWKYTETNRCTGVHASCIDYCANFTSCDRWENGVQRVPASGTTSESTGIVGAGQLSCGKSCNMSGVCSAPSCTGSAGQPTSECQAAANVRINALETLAGNEIMLETTFDTLAAQTQRVNQAKSLIHATPSIVKQQFNYTVSTPGLGGMSIHSWKERWTCSLAVVNARASAGENSSCPGCDQLLDSSCERDCGQTAHETAPGATRPSGPYIGTQTCTTCDDLSTATPSQVAAKYDCLKTAYMGAPPVTADAAQFDRAIVARLKLLYEWHAGVLSATQRAFILPRYDEAGQATCNPIDVDDACLAMGLAAGINNDLQLCKNLTATGISIAAVNEVLPRCLGLFDKVPAISDDACRVRYRDEIADDVQELLERSLEGVTFSADVFSGLPAALARIDAWWEHATLAAGEDRSWLQGRSSVVVAQLWHRAYGLSATLPDTVNAASVESMLTLLDGSSLTTEYAVLAAAFAPGSSFDTPPLLAIVGDALRTSVDRLETVSEIHDLVCRYRPCPVTMSSQTAEMWRILAALPEQPKLTGATAPSATPKLSLAHANLALVFRAMATQHVNLRTAYTAAGGAELPELRFLDVLPPEAYALAALVRLANARFAQFQQNGQFIASGALELHAGMQNKQVVIDQLGARLSALNLAYGNYLTDRIVLVNSLLAQLRNGAEQTSLEDRLDQVFVRLNRVASELTGLQMREGAERTAWASYVEAFDAMREAGVFDDEVNAQVDVLPAQQLSAASARYQGGAANLDTIAVRATDDQGHIGPWKRTLTPGQQLRFNVSGQWAPSCALQQAEIDGPTGDTYGITKADALTGPEGYLVQWTGSEFEAQGWSEDTVKNLHATVELCAKLTWGTPDSAADFLGAQFEVWLQACVGGGWQHNWGDSESGGSDNRTSAAFQAGLRLPSTPFPQATAGALLLVVTPAGNPYDVIDIQIVHRQSVYLAPSNVDTYLVVNDRSGGCTTKPDSIVVESFLTTSLGALAGPLSVAMAETLQHIEAQSAAILAQGDLMPGEEQLLRLWARQRVSLLTGVDATALPQGVQEFFDTWLTAEMVSLQRRAAIERRHRDIEMLALERKAVGHDLENAGAASRLLALIPRWQLRQLQTSRLGLEQRAVLRYLRDYVPPIFELRYPRALAELVSSPDASVSAKLELDRLQTLDFASAADDVASKLLAFGDKAKASLDEAVADSHDYGVAMAALAFPDPDDYLASGEEPPPNCEQFGTCAQTAGPPVTLWNAVEISRAQEVWSGLREHGWATFEIRPEDLYDISGGSAQLTCYDSAPIIRKMALYVVTDDGVDYGGIFYRPAMHVGSELEFPTRTGTRTYVKTDEDWLFTGLPVMGGAESEALTDLIPHNSSAASGLSPFNTFSVNLQNFPIDLDVTSQLVVVFELETRPIAAPGVALDECQ